MHTRSSTVPPVPIVVMTVLARTSFASRFTFEVTGGSGSTPLATPPTWWARFHTVSHWNGPAEPTPVTVSTTAAASPGTAVPLPRTFTIVTASPGLRTAPGGVVKYGGNCRV